MTDADDQPAGIPTSQFFRALAAQLATQVEVDLFLQAELEAILTLFARHYDELHQIDGVAELSSKGKLGVDWTVFGRRDPDGTYRVSYIQLKPGEEEPSA